MSPNKVTFTFKDKFPMGNLRLLMRIFLWENLVSTGNLKFL